MKHRDRWADCDIVIEGPLLVRDWWEWTVEIQASRTIEDEDTQAFAALAAVDWCDRFVDVSPGVLIELASSKGSISDLGELIINRLRHDAETLGTRGRPASGDQKADPGSGIRGLLDVASGAREYDDNAAEKPCECSECSGGLAQGEQDPSCLFRITPANPTARAVIMMNPEMVREYWDQPFKLYQFALQRFESRTLARRVPDQKDRAAAELRAQKHVILKRHGRA